MKRRKVPVSFIFLLVLIALTFFPMYFMLISSLKNNTQIYENYFFLSQPFHWEYYKQAYDKVAKYLLNSCAVSLGTVAVVVAISVPTAYIFAKKTFAGKGFLYGLILSFLMIPSVLTLVPAFVLNKRLSLINTYYSCIFPYSAWGIITFIYILRSFVEGIPGDLFDSARIDGAGEVRVMRNIVLPLSKGVIISLALMNLLSSWNDYVWPSIVMPKDKMKTVTVGLYSFMEQQQIKYGPMFAGFAIASLPPILLLCLNMNYFVSGITSGAIKG